MPWFGRPEQASNLADRAIRLNPNYCGRWWVSLKIFLSWSGLASAIGPVPYCEYAQGPQGNGSQPTQISSPRRLLDIATGEAPRTRRDVADATSSKAARLEQKN